MSAATDIQSAFIGLAGDSMGGLSSSTVYKPLGDIVGGDLPYLQIYQTDLSTAPQSWGQTATEIGFQVQLMTDRGATGKEFGRDRLEYLRRLLADDPTLGGKCIRAEFEDVTYADVPSLNRNLAQLTLRAEVWDRYETPDSLETVVGFGPPPTEGDQNWTGTYQPLGGAGYASLYASGRVDCTAAASSSFARYQFSVDFNHADLPADLSDGNNYRVRFRVNPSALGMLAAIDASSYAQFRLASVGNSAAWAAEQYFFYMGASYIDGGWHTFEFDPSSPDATSNPFGGTAVSLSNVQYFSFLFQKTTPGNASALARAFTFDRVFRINRNP